MKNGVASGVLFAMSLLRNLNVRLTYTDRIIARIADFTHEVSAFQFVRKRLQLK